MRTLILASLIAAPAAALAQQAAPAGLSPFQEMIRRQLDSVTNERPPAPVPGIEAERMRELPPLPRQGNQPLSGRARNADRREP
jgi:hypothetical protein